MNIKRNISISQMGTINKVKNIKKALKLGLSTQVTSKSGSS